VARRKQKIEAFQYTTPAPAPRNYVCSGCGASGCKLWREYQTCADVTELVCCDCAGKSQNHDVSRITDEGKTPFSIGHYADGTEAIQWSDAIGWRVPAVPTEDGDTFWGYTSVPAEGVRWWKALPTRCSRG
jgi:hypothetical protein